MSCDWLPYISIPATIGALGVIGFGIYDRWRERNEVARASRIAGRRIRTNELRREKKFLEERKREHRSDTI